MLIDTHMLLAPFVLILQMHTDMGDERGIRLRCICLGRAALRGSRMRGIGICSKVSEPCFARSSLSIARSSVCATTRCLRINITIRPLVPQNLRSVVSRGRRIGAQQQPGGRASWSRSASPRCRPTSWRPLFGLLPRSTSLVDFQLLPRARLPRRNCCQPPRRRLRLYPSHHLPRYQPSSSRGFRRSPRKAWLLPITRCEQCRRVLTRPPKSCSGG